MTDLNLNNLKMDFKYIENSETAWNPNGVNGCDEESFIRNNPNAGKSIFKELDFNKDGYISEQEFACAKNMAGDDGILTDKERNDSCMEEMKFFARRGIDKWFKIDKDRDGFATNVEMESWSTYCENGKTLEGAMSNKQLANKYNMQEKIISDMQSWLDSEIEDIKNDARTHFGVELTQKQIIEIKKEQIKQLNNWLLKSGDNEEASFYQQLNLDAYTRLMSTRDGEACCGGDICEFAGFSPSDLEKNGKYTSKDMKARLEWAENSYMVDDNGKTVLDANGQTIPAKMMTDAQVQKYKEIVESVTGKPWDSDDWEVSSEQWCIICEKVNGTYGDETRLEGKTRADVPENRQALLRFLEQKGWLYEQFK